MLFWGFVVRRNRMGIGEGFISERSWIYVEKVLWFCVGELERKSYWSFFWIDIFYYGGWC